MSLASGYQVHRRIFQTIREGSLVGLVEQLHQRLNQGSGCPLALKGQGCLVEQLPGPIFKSDDKAVTLGCSKIAIHHA